MLVARRSTSLAFIYRWFTLLTFTILTSKGKPIEELLGPCALSLLFSEWNLPAHCSGDKFSWVTASFHALCSGLGAVLFVFTVALLFPTPLVSFDLHTKDTKAIHIWAKDKLRSSGRFQLPVFRRPWPVDIKPHLLYALGCTSPSFLHPGCNILPCMMWQAWCTSDWMGAMVP